MPWSLVSRTRGSGTSSSTLAERDFSPTETLSRHSPPPGQSPSHSIAIRSETSPILARLGRLMRAETVRAILELCDEFTPGHPPVYFFDRNPDNFPAILNMYRTGKLHATERGCALVLQRDLQVNRIKTYGFTLFILCLVLGGGRHEHGALLCSKVLP